ncbi:unnamed protein product [Euphydryas editha]|uniref:V-type proton ATPase subunit S1/VOA1 transmembrane domain-containing protein n=1 Tax=Euphydryas editha TaxID=104508 RepID=A0AAU9UPG0_EUPED|nr:unnamed protein product [Euphydryas editha]
MSTLAIFFLILQSSFAERDTAPVFILDHEKLIPRISTELNPFKILKTSEFTKIINEAVTRGKVIILFIEESFCIEDISVKDKHGSPFYQMSQRLKEKRVKFLPAVIQPYKTLKSRFPPENTNEFYLSDTGTKIKVYDGKSKYFYIYFKDSLNETRANALRRHDLLIHEIYFEVRQIAGSSIVAFYTGKTNPILAEKMNFLPVKTQKITRQPGVIITTTNAIFRFIDVYTTMGTRRATFSQIPLIADETWKKRSLTTRLAYTDFELEFTFKLRKDWWMIENVLLLEWGEEVGRTEMRVGAPWDWSYICSEPLVLVNMRDGSAVTISQYQIQPFNNGRHIGRNASGNDTRCFGPAVNCGPYFNAHILAGLMVTFFCIGILTYGVTTMYNCHSNDRYDDQHGKPLVIAAEAGG